MASPRLGRLTAVAGAFVALSLAIAAPAWADTTFQLKQSNVTAAGFDTHSCDNIPGGPVAGKDGWLFVLPDKPRVFVSSVQKELEDPGRMMESSDNHPTIDRHHPIWPLPQ